MAARKPGNVAAPAKQKLRKNHGPKRRMFKDYKPLTHDFARSGILSKYYNYESFAQAMAARGIRTNIKEMWSEFFKILDLKEKMKYILHAKENEKRITADKENRNKDVKKVPNKVKKDLAKPKK